MALNLDKIPADVLESLEARGHSEEQIRRMTPEKAFDEHLRWNGIQGYGYRFFREVNELMEAEERS